MKINYKLALSALFGNVIISFGVCVLRISQMGIDPFSAMNLGVSTCIGVGLGFYQSIFNIALLIPVIFLNRKSFGIGSIINMFLFGYMVQWFTAILNAFGITTTLPLPIYLKVILLVVGFLICNAGASVYMASNTGVGPYDAIAPIISDKTHLPFKITRIMTDLTCGVIGFVSGMIAGITTIGPATILFIFGCGPIITWYRETFVDAFIEKLK